jgi:lysophospholipase L1-like esterase
MSMKRSILALIGVVVLVGAWADIAPAQTRPTTPPGTPAGAGGRGGAGFGGAGARGGGRGAVAGPPAPVPAQVAIPRPTADELVRLNADLKRLVEADNSPDKALLDKYESLIQVQLPRANSAIAPTPRNAQRHADFVATAEKGDIDLLLDGDSITDWWTRNGQTAYDKYFGTIKTANFAIAGDTTQGVLWGLQNGEGKGFQPKAIMLMVGTNNTAGNTAPEIAEGVGAVVLEMRKDFPNAKILLLAIFPRGDPGDAVRGKIADVNKIIAKLDDQQHVFYMDIGSKFLDDKGVFLPDAFLADKLHPQEKGYEIWGDAVKDPLANMLK